MIKQLLTAGAIFGFTAVAFGAIGAHKLKELISATDLEIFEKGVTYQFCHVFAIVTSAVLLKQYNLKRFYYSGIFFITGIICFSGSLYLLALREINISGDQKLSDLISTSIIGPITPIGGLLFLTGWIVLFSGVVKIKP